MEAKEMNFEDMRKVKGTPYEIVGENVIVYEAEKEPVTLPLVLGKSVYSVVFSHLNAKGTGRGRRSDGIKTIGNFTYTVVDDLLTVNHKDGSVLGTKELVEDTEIRYPRTQAINLIVNTLE